MMTFKGISPRTHRPCSECRMRPVLPPKRKCMRCIGAKGKRKTLRPGNKGRRAVGTTLSRPDRIRTRKAKRQNTGSLGMQPREVTAYAMRKVR